MEKEKSTYTPLPPCNENGFHERNLIPKTDFCSGYDFYFNGELITHIICIKKKK